MDKNKKNKEGMGNIISFIGIILIILGAIKGFSNMDENWAIAFFCCLIGTILNFVGGYLRDGYIKFFN